ncbi:hypothetical protein [Microvirga sp. Mcv34]|uniref:hypothetical protein n=1 Tax=Microvirga sp. Mcv34 TaxID=2926016 RepID=UPI0021C76E9B|nr:hypothetical protein [Microvirga sp. Mcv34]
MITLIGVLMTQPVMAQPSSWEWKDAHRKCASAIEGNETWPSEPVKACAAMHMCANEAVLSNKQQMLLLSAIRRIPNCQDP